MSLSNAILRGVTGAFVLNSGLSKRGMPTEAAQGLQGFAATGVPAVNQMDPDTFSKFVAYSEIGIGAALLTPDLHDVDDDTGPPQRLDELVDLGR